MKRGTADNRQYQDRLRRREKEHRRKQDADLRELMKLPVGRRFAWRLLNEMAGVFAPTFTGNSQTFHLEGRRSVGIDLMQEIQRVAPDAYALMVSERMAELADDALHHQDAEQQAREETDE